MTASGYKDLIDSYLGHQVSVNEFARRLESYFHDGQELDQTLFLIINSVFEAEDACYVPGLPPDQETNSCITEATLRKELAVARAKIEEYIVSNAPP